MPEMMQLSPVHAQVPLFQLVYSDWFTKKIELIMLQRKFHQLLDDMRTSQNVHNRYLFEGLRRPLTTIENAHKNDRDLKVKEFQKEIKELKVHPVSQRLQSEIELLEQQLEILYTKPQSSSSGIGEILVEGMKDVQRKAYDPLVNVFRA